MITIHAVVHDAEGLHARPAGIVCKAAKEFGCATTIGLDKTGSKADAKRLFALMGLKIKCGDALTVTFEGADETAAAAKLTEILQTV